MHKTGMCQDKREAAAIKLAVRDVLNGTAMITIARRWNEQGFRTPRKGSRWGVTDVRVSLLNPRHAGYMSISSHIDIGSGTDAPMTRRHYARGARANWKPIISLADHERLVMMLCDPDRRKKNPPRRGAFTGLLVCECGANMMLDREHYRCKRLPDTNGCGANTIPAEMTNDVIRALVLDEFADPKFWGDSTRRGGRSRHRNASVPTHSPRSNATMRRSAVHVTRGRSRSTPRSPSGNASPNVVVISCPSTPTSRPS